MPLRTLSFANYASIFSTIRCTDLKTRTVPPLKWDCFQPIVVSFLPASPFLPHKNIHADLARIGVGLGI